jgi:hydrolase family protein
MKDLYNSETGCCPRFDPAPWDEAEHVWQEKKFIKDNICAFLHIPIGFGKVVVRNMEKIQSSNAATEQPPIFLCDECSLWKTGLFIETSKDVPDSKMVSISGTFLTKVFEGPYKDAPKWHKQMEQFVQSKGKQMKKMYAYYTTCPKCAKVYGKNYTVMVAKV